MQTKVQRLIGWNLLLALILAACAPGAASIPEPTNAPVIPTNTPPPTATSTPIPTDTPLPTDTPTATATATARPTSTATATARPTATPTPGPGDVVYQVTKTSDWKQWREIYFGTDKYTLTPEGNGLTMKIDGQDTYVYVTYAPPFAYSDIQLDVDVDVLSGPNENYQSVVCRYSGDGWYEFNVASGGMWTIFKFVKGQGFTALKSGGSTAIKANQGGNHLTAVCQGDSLTLYINDVEIATAHDKQFSHGSFGVSASTFDLAHVQLRFYNFTVRLADSAAHLGGAVAPTVPPSSGGGSDANSGLAGLFVFPLPGGTLGNVNLQADTLTTMLVLIAQDAPGCQDLHVTWTEVVPGTPLVYDDKGNVDPKAWRERWIVSHCGAESAYSIVYSHHSDGGIDYVISRWSSGATSARVPVREENRSGMRI